MKFKPGFSIIVKLSNFLNLVLYPPLKAKNEEGLNTNKQEGKRSGKSPKPSKFVPGKISHTGYVSDDFGGFSPMWFNELDPNSKDPQYMAYSTVK